MQESQKPSSRKKFLLLTGAALLSASILRIIAGRSKEKTDKVRMLTQDGKLVEIDKNLLGPPGKKISNRELQQWIKNKTGKE